MVKSSFTNRLWNFCIRHANGVAKCWATIITYCKCSFQDVNLGEKIEFVGLPKFNVGNGGQIKIGKGCQFLSRETCNNMGLNHRCILSSTPPNEGIECKLVIGNDCGFSGVSIWCFNSIIIGNNVRVGANTQIIDGDAHFDDPRTSPPKPIVIEDGVFIGANVVVKKGVRIGRNSVIGMNSVVTHDVPPNVVAAGNPCKVIKSLDQ